MDEGRRVGKWMDEGGWVSVDKELSCDGERAGK